MNPGFALRNRLGSLMFRSRGPRRCTVHLPLRTDQLPTPLRTQLSIAHWGFAAGDPGVSPDRTQRGRADNPRGRERTGSRKSWPAIFEPNRPGIRRGPPDPALCHGLALGSCATSAERYGRVFCALTVSETNY
jgi:hypothetical protein